MLLCKIQAEGRAPGHCGMCRVRRRLSTCSGTFRIGEGAGSFALLPLAGEGGGSFELLLGEGEGV